MTSILEPILRESGDMLRRMPPEARAEGRWEGSQFKAAADVLAHDFLTAELGSALSLPIVSEEDEKNLHEQFVDYVVIDPIDGTASFANGFNGWVTQAAVIQNKKVVSSAIFAPDLDEFYSAEKDQGCTFNGKVAPVPGSVGLESIIDNYPEPRGMTREIFSLLGLSQYIECGSIALKICRVATGEADLFIKNMWPRDWDLAAPLLVAQETGIYLRDWYGEKYDLGKPGRRHAGVIAVNNETSLARVRQAIIVSNLAMLESS